MKKTVAILCLLSAVLLSIPWLVPHTGFLALVAFVPLLCAERVASLSGMRSFFIWHYSTFVLWNAFTTFWVCNATVGGGIAAIVLNALQMSLVFGAFRFSKRYFSGFLPYVFLAALWISWERLYFDAQISWPWLVLGNAFAGSTGLAQWYSVTGVEGGSLWIWAVNLGIFSLMTSLSEGKWSAMGGRARAIAGACLAVLVVFPAVASVIMYSNRDMESERSADVLVCQPDFDPYHKFESMTQAQQNSFLAGQIAAALPAGEAHPDLILAPETFTNGICLNDVSGSPSMRYYKSVLASYPGTDFLFGASSYEVYRTKEPPSALARQYGKNWLEEHNSAVITDSSGRYEIFHKSKLVVGTELTPYPEIFVPLDNLLGGVMGRCIGQDEISLLHLQDGTPLGCAVCYESVYGDYCRDYVKKGALFMTVITNDAWWGDTPGYRQHLNYSRLRAIELGRDIARSANTGISAFIDKRGDIVSSTGWWKAEVLRGKVNLYSGITPFVRYGDVTGSASLFLSIILLALLFVRAVTGKRLSE